MSNEAKARIDGSLRSLVLGIVFIYMLPVHAAADQSENALSFAHHATRHLEGNNLDDRVAALAKALDLDATQQTRLRELLLYQREQVARVWRDASVPAAYRVNSTRLISDKTADKIRAMLTEAQREKFNPPRQPHDAAHDSSSRTVEEWMTATRAK